MEAVGEVTAIGASPPLSGREPAGFADGADEDIESLTVSASRFSSRYEKSRLLSRKSYEFA